MRKPLRLLLPLLLVALALTACYEPLEYELVINVSDTGAYDMSFDGTIGAFPIREAQLAGAPEEQLQPMISEAQEALTDRDGVEAYEYRDDGTFYVRGSESFTETSTSVIFELPSLTATREPGKLTFTSASLHPSDKEYWATTYGFTHDGHIILRTSNEILESNGKQGPRGHYWDNELLEREGMRITIATP